MENKSGQTTGALGSGGGSGGMPGCMHDCFWAVHTAAGLLHIV